MTMQIATSEAIIQPITARLPRLSEADTIRALLDAGVTVVCDGNRLRVEPAGAVDADVLEAIAIYEGKLLPKIRRVGWEVFWRIYTLLQSFYAFGKDRTIEMLEHVAGTCCWCGQACSSDRSYCDLCVEAAGLADHSWKRMKETLGLDG
jgi:hypothetical protein